MADSSRAWTVATRLLVLLAIPCAGLAVLAVAGYRTLNLVQINGPVYARVADGKDLIADVLPPPEFIIEASQSVFEAMADGDPSAAAARLSQRLTPIEAAFEARQQIWRDKLPPGPLRDALLNEVARPARGFFATARSVFVPALERGEREAAQRVIDGPLAAAYRSHRTAVERVVVLARAQNEAQERWAGEETRRASSLMVGIAVATLVLSLLAALLVARSFNAMARALRSRNDALTSSNADLQRANKELEAFSYSVSHDLRTPLRAILGFSATLNEDFGESLPPEAHRQLGIITANAKHMGQLIDDLLAFAHNSQMPLRRETIDMNEMVRACADELSAERAGRDVRLLVSPLPPSSADPTLTKQVWLNLLSNAFKFTRSRASAIIEVSARQEGEGKEVVYVVKDNGEGFDMQYADKVFVVFQRLHRQDVFQGTGVGLALVHRIVTRHGGRIWVNAMVGAGATFSFTFGGATQA